MKIAPAPVTPPPSLSEKLQRQAELNPAKQAKTADPAVKGAEFGALVSEIAHARNAARFEAKHGEPASPPPPAPVVEPPSPATPAEPPASEATTVAPTAADTAAEPAPAGSPDQIALALLANGPLDISV